MQQQYVKPLVLILRHIHPNPITPQLKMHPRILHVSNTIQSQMRVAFLQQHRPHSDPVLLGSGGSCVGTREWEIEFADVVDETGDGKHVEGTERAFGPRTLWVVVVAVDGEDGDTDVEVTVFVIDGGKTKRSCQVSQTWSLGKIIALTSNRLPFHHLGRSRAPFLRAWCPSYILAGGP